MWGCRWRGVIAFVLVTALAVPAKSEPRVALVIGNGSYNGPLMRPLKNPSADATLMAESLKKTGFQVLVALDVKQSQMKRAIADFGKRLAEAGPQATGLLFYGGYGLQIHGTNFLVPIGADLQSEADVELEAVALDRVLEQMQFAGNKVNIAIVDASRNNPLARGFRAAGEGLAQVDYRQPGLYLAYSAAPGTVVSDGNRKNSPYVAALAPAILQPGSNIHDVFESVRRSVLKQTNAQQVTWDVSTMTEPFYFVPNK